MQRRALLYLINIAVLVVTLLVFFLVPRYGVYAFYGFLGWFVVSIAAVWMARGSTPVAGPVATPAAPSPPRPSASPAPVRRPAPGPTAPATPEVGFCIYCGTDLPAGLDRCPACGHAGARLT